MEYVGYPVGFLIVLVLFWMAVYPPYSVWAARKRGEAAFADALGEQKIQIARAHSRLEAAENNKKAAIVEAEAVEAQIKKIGEGLQHHDLYLRWQWIKMMEERHAESDTIYVATEAGLPILEASRIGKSSESST